MDVQLFFLKSRVHSIKGTQKSGISASSPCRLAVGRTEITAGTEWASALLGVRELLGVGSKWELQVCSGNRKAFPSDWVVHFYVSLYKWQEVSPFRLLGPATVWGWQTCSVSSVVCSPSLLSSFHPSFVSAGSVTQLMLPKLSFFTWTLHRTYLCSFLKRDQNESSRNGESSKWIPSPSYFDLKNCLDLWHRGCGDFLFHKKWQMFLKDDLILYLIALPLVQTSSCPVACREVEVPAVSSAQVSLWPGKEHTGQPAESPGQTWG